MSFPRALRYSGIVALAWILLLVLTRSLFIGDTTYFVDDILGFLHGDATVWPRIADFGHVVWRPLGWLLSAAVLRTSLIRRPEPVVIAGVLIVINMAATAVYAFALLIWSLRVTRSPFAAIVASVCFLWTNTIVACSRSGMPWIPGLAFLMVACVLALPNPPRPAWISGLAAGTSVLLWMPYLLTVPAVLSVRLLTPGGQQKKAALREVLQFAGAAALVTVAGYIVAAALRHVNSLGSLADWIRESSHGDVRNGLLMRFLFGLPRSVVAFGDEGLLLKRFVYHDPYTRVGLWEVAKLGLFKLAPFYAAVLLVFCSVCRSAHGRYLALLLLVAAIPNLVLALTFDSSSMERYLAWFPFLFLCLAYFISRAKTIPLITVCALCTLLVLCNFWQLSTARVNATLRGEASRAAALAASTRPADVLYILNGQDALVRLRYSEPFDLNLRRLPDIAGIQPFLGAPATWRERMVADVLTDWQEARDVWITVRVRAARPEASWNWAEGSVPGISWPAIRSAFEHMQFGRVIGGSDGFALLEPTESNRALLAALAHNPQIPITPEGR